MAKPVKRQTVKSSISLLLPQQSIPCLFSAAGNEKGNRYRRNQPSHIQLWSYEVLLVMIALYQGNKNRYNAGSMFPLNYRKHYQP